jgi:hypothetical protein
METYFKGVLVSHVLETEDDVLAHSYSDAAVEDRETPVMGKDLVDAPSDGPQAQPPAEPEPEDPAEEEDPIAARAVLLETENTKSVLVEMAQDLGLDGKGNKSELAMAIAQAEEALKG